MKKIIITVITGLVFVSAGYAQSQDLTELFNIYAQEEGFSYIYMGKGYSELKRSVSDDFAKDFSSVKFVKILSSEKPKDIRVKDVISTLKAYLAGEEFELIFKMVEKNKEKIEIYLKRSNKKDLEKIIIMETTKDVRITWIYGEGK